MEWIRANPRFIFMTLALMQGYSCLQAANLECPANLSNGQPACSVSSDIGSTPPDSATSQHVGNPIDVVSGNKYQSEVDVMLGNSHLSLVRHYNSSNAAQNIGLGNGWRHTYSVGLTSAGNDVRRIEQSDGRVITFRRRGDQFFPVNEVDGVLTATSSNRHVWQLPDGRSLAFSGSFLTNIRFLDGGELRLFYRDMRLFSVSDEQGKALEFHYAPGNIGLPAYENSQGEVAPSGHLIEVVLSDGSSIRFEYSNFQNLVLADYPRGTQRNKLRGYRYEDPLNSGLLTERIDGWGRAMARWSFDEHGRAVSYRSGGSISPDGSETGPPNLSLKYSSEAENRDGITTVSYRDGTIRNYEWHVDGGGNVVLLKSVVTEASADLQSNSDKKLSSNPLGDTYTQRYPHDVMTVLALGALGYPSKIRHSLARDGSTHLLKVEYDQAGRIDDVNWQSGTLEGVNGGQETNHEYVEKFVEDNEVFGTNLETMISLLGQKGHIEATARNFLDSVNRKLTVGSTVTGEELDEAWVSQLGLGRSQGKDAETDEPEGCSESWQDCASLLRTRDYAEVAACAYIKNPCNTRFVEANLDDLGLDMIDLHEDSFHAEIFHDVKTGEYIVTFAGTDMFSGGDWGSNIEQERGRYAFQYEKAVRLARILLGTVPASQLRFVGHSLGGGLATAAASAAVSEAIVFNPAGFTQESANGLGVDYEISSSNTTIYSVEGELLSNLQTGTSLLTEPPGTMNILNEPNFAWVQQNVGQNPLIAYGTRLSLQLHGIDAVQQSLEDLIERYQCT